MSKARFTLYRSKDRVRELEDEVRRLRAALEFEAAWYRRLGWKQEERRIRKVLDGS